jgi:hypothetical protein
MHTEKRTHIKSRQVFFLPNKENSYICSAFRMPFVQKLIFIQSFSAKNQLLFRLAPFSISVSYWTGSGFKPRSQDSTCWWECGLILITLASKMPATLSPFHVSSDSSLTIKLRLFKIEPLDSALSEGLQAFLINVICGFSQELYQNFGDLQPLPHKIRIHAMISNN